MSAPDFEIDVVAALQSVQRVFEADRKKDDLIEERFALQAEWLAQLEARVNALQAIVSRDAA